jgi:hypothetical protein
MKPRSLHPGPQARRLFKVALVGKIVSYSLLHATAVASQEPPPVPTPSSPAVVMPSSQELAGILTQPIAGPACDPLESTGRRP